MTIGSTGRVFGSVAGVKRTIRQYLRLDGQPISGVDIRASQPSLLANVLTHGMPAV